MSKWIEWQEVDSTGKFLDSKSFPLDGDFGPSHSRAYWNYNDEWEWITHIATESSSTWIYRVLDNEPV